MPLVDATYLIALLDATDQWHPRALQAFPMLRKRQPWRVHALVLAETLTLIGARHGGKAARRAYDMVADATERLLPDAAALEGGMEAHVRFDGTLSFSDALTVHYAEALEDREILSFDADFDRKGVHRLPR